MLNIPYKNKICTDFRMVYVKSGTIFKFITGNIYMF